MEGIDLAGVVDSDFQGIQINFAPPRPAGFANFCGAGRGGARLAFLRGGAGQPFFRGAGRGGAGRTSLVLTSLSLFPPPSSLFWTWYIRVFQNRLNRLTLLTRHVLW